MRGNKQQRILVITGAVAFCCGILWIRNACSHIHLQVDATAEMSFEGFNNESGAKGFIVPNIVHFIRLNKTIFSFVDAVTVLAAFKNQRPDKIMFHANDANFAGRHWEKIKNTPGLVYEIVHTEVPDRIYGQQFSRGWHLFHAGDVLRIKVLMKYGGIFLDNDSYLVRSLDKFRMFEMAIAWDEGRCIGTQIIVAHKNARFLPLWLYTYRVYHPDRWYYNAGCKPTEEVLHIKPELIHRVKLLFGVEGMIHHLYKSNWKDWRNQYAIHLMINHRSYLDKEHYKQWPEFDENNVKTFNCTFGTMAKEAYGIK